MYHKNLSIQHRDMYFIIISAYINVCIHGKKYLDFFHN